MTPFRHCKREAQAIARLPWGSVSRGGGDRSPGHEHTGVRLKTPSPALAHLLLTDNGQVRILPTQLQSLSSASHLSTPAVPSSTLNMV